MKFWTLVAGLALVFGAATVSAGPRSPSFISSQRFDGEVQQIDAKTGAITVSTRAGTVRFDAVSIPPGRLVKGAPVAVDLVVLRGAARPAADGGADVLLRRRVQADVARIDAAVGMLELAWPAGYLRIDVPAAALRTFKKGDRVPIEVALALAPSPSASVRSDPKRQERGALGTFLIGILGRK